MTDLPNSQRRVKAPDPKIQRVPVDKWVRVYFNDRLIAGSRGAVLVRGRPPVYYFPPDDVFSDYLEGDTGASIWSIRAGDQIAERAAWSYGRVADDPGDLEGYVAFKFDAMGAWFEEDEQIYVHPRDPYTRIDVLPSSRHVQVVVAGQVVAESNRPVLLFETGLPTRYYLPKLDIQMDALVPTDHHTGCPYKGTASYYSLRVGDTVLENVAWYYPFPHPEVSRIQNLVSFYDERIDDFYVDGQQLPILRVDRR